MFGLGWKTQSAPRRSVETTGAWDGGLATLTHGLMVGTRVASNLGWRPIEALTVGDKVLTFDHGMQPIAEIRRAYLWLDAPETAEALWPVVVPVGALGNREELSLLPDQGVMVETDGAMDAMGDPFAVLTARALVGVRGITRRRPMHRVELISLYFDAEQVIFAEGGALIHCPPNLTALDRFIEVGGEARYPVLDGAEAQVLADFIMIEDQMATPPVAI